MDERRHEGGRRALIVAGYEYEDPGLRRLRAPARDAEELARVLRDPQIGDFDVHTSLNDPAHVVNEAVEDFFAERAPGDLLVLHFSCHGVKDEGGELYFAMANTKLRRLGATAVSADFVNRTMTRSRSRRIVLLLDCCYAGAFGRGMMPRAGTAVHIEEQFSGRGRAVITASGALEYAFEDAELADPHEPQPSIFSRAIVEGLDTGDADRDQDGYVGLDELYDYVYDRVREVTPNQTPGKWMFGVEGDLHIARRRGPVAIPELPAALQDGIEHPVANIRLGAVRELEQLLRARHGGRALAARVALERLTGDDSRMVASAAVDALGGQTLPAPPARSVKPQPSLELSASAVDFGRLLVGSSSPSHVVQVRNSGGGNLTPRIVAAPEWVHAERAGDQLVLTANPMAVGAQAGEVVIQSEFGWATIHVSAQVDQPQPPPFRPPGTAPIRTVEVGGVSPYHLPELDPMDIGSRLEGPERTPESVVEEPVGYGYGDALHHYGSDLPGYYMGRALANWPQRIGATLIDLLTSIPAWLLVWLGGGITMVPSFPWVELKLFSSPLTWIGCLVGIASFLYANTLEGRTGQTWGKMALKLRVVRMADGQPVGSLMAFVRKLLHAVDALPCFIGLLFPLWDVRRQTLADKLARTVVLYEG